jgi:hypothetical protein
MKHYGLNLRLGRICWMGLFALAVATQLASGQTRAITDADVQNVATILALQVRQLNAGATFQQEREKVYASAHEDAKAVAAGERDAWDVLRSYQAAAVAPPGGVYSARCSVHLTEETKLATTWAVFGFNVPADELGVRVMRGDSSAVLEIIEKNLAGGQRTHAEQRVHSLLKTVTAFYEARGYKPPPRLAGHVFGWWLETVGVGLRMYPVNIYSDAEACAGLGNGPILVVIGQSDLPESAVSAHAAVMDGYDDMSSALERLRLTREQYDDIRTAVLLAHDDAHAREPLESGLDPLLLEYLKESLAQRRKNAEVYRRHAARLDPLIRAWREQLP